MMCSLTTFVAPCPAGSCLRWLGDKQAACWEDSGASGKQFSPDVFVNAWDLQRRRPLTEFHRPPPLLQLLLSKGV